MIVLQIIFEYVKSLVFSILFFLLSYHTFVNYKDRGFNQIDRPLSQGERGELLFSSLVAITPGGKYTYGVVFGCIGIFLLVLQTKKMMTKIKSKDDKRPNADVKKNTQITNDVQEIDKEQIRKEIRKSDMKIKRRF